MDIIVTLMFACLMFNLIGRGIKIFQDSHNGLTIFLKIIRVFQYIMILLICSKVGVWIADTFIN